MAELQCQLAGNQLPACYKYSFKNISVSLCGFVVIFDEGSVLGKWPDVCQGS